MSDSENNNPDFKTYMMVAYIVYLIPAPLSILIGVILCYVIRNDTLGTIYHSHINGLISLFWKSVLATICVMAGFIMLVMKSPILALLFYLLLLIWTVYYYVKAIQGIVRMTSGRRFDGSHPEY